MRRLRASLLSFVVAASLAGCATNVVATAVPPRGYATFLRVIPPIGQDVTYMIDPTTELCFLMAGGGIAPIDCGVLARNLPEAASKIVWLKESPPPPAATP